MDEVQLGIVIVNYNTREELLNCLQSIYQSHQTVSYRVWVVDNDSSDGSADMVAACFPQVRLIRSGQNAGFAKSNNGALREMTTAYVLLLNPDTLVSSHVFDATIGFLERNPQAGMVTCKLVKKDGTLDLACRRSFPTVFDGLCRAVGLSAAYPKSKRFARYNLTFLDENEIAQVDAVNGAFMMIRSEALYDVGLLDEDYFMYMEDLDWCFRFRQKGWRVFYDPSTTVVHLKGQAGRKTSTRMIQAFFTSMELFCRKHYLPARSYVHYLAIVMGIRTWKWATLLRNAIRTEKRVTP